MAKFETVIILIYLSLYIISIFESAKVGILIQKSMPVWHIFPTFAKYLRQGNN